MCWNIRCSWLQRANIQACQSDGPFQGGYLKLPDWLWVCETTWLDATAWDSILLSSGSPISGIVIVSTANQQKIITFFATGDVGEIPVSWSARAFLEKQATCNMGTYKKCLPISRGGMSLTEQAFMLLCILLWQDEADNYFAVPINGRKQQLSHHLIPIKQHPF